MRLLDVDEIRVQRIMTDYLDVPILFMIFNRPSTTIPVFERIKNAKPKKLYIAADGPRTKPGEAEVCQKVREIINEIDWDCEVHTLFRTENLGCKMAIRTAIDWFFENEEMGIILEDDCLADPSFFDFCEILLKKYKDEERVMMITGTSFLNSGLKGPYKFYFSQYFAIWGWATWRRSWLSYDTEMSIWPEMKRNMVLKKKFGAVISSSLESIAQSTYDGKHDTWDIQWFISCINKNGLCIAPKINLISNIGINGVHYNGNSKQLFVPTRSIGEIINFPSIEFDPKLDKRAYKNISLDICSSMNRKLYFFLSVLWKINMKKFENPKVPILTKLIAIGK